MITNHEMARGSRGTDVGKVPVAQTRLLKADFDRQKQTVCFLGVGWAFNLMSHRQIESADFTP